jgi:hypothetical protein
MDNEHLAALFEGKLSFWPFPDLNDFASEQLSVVGCSSATCLFNPMEPGGVDEQLSQQLNKHWSLICAFLHSDKWKSAVRQNADTALSQKPAIRRAMRIAVKYELAGVTVEEPEGKSSFFDVESGTLWLEKGLDEDDAAEAMGDALQEVFGPEVLREFVCDLFRKANAKALEKWRKKGLMLTAPIEFPTEGQKRSPEDEVEPVQHEAQQAEDSVGRPEAAETTRAASVSDPEHPRQHQTSGRDGESSSASGNMTGKTPVSGDGQPPQKTDPMTGLTTSPAGTQGEQAADQEEDKDYETSVGGKEPATTVAAVGVQQALNDAFNKTGNTQITDDRPESGGVRNSGDRRRRTRENYSSRKSREPAAGQRTTQRTVDIWDAKNKGVRDFLYEQYSGRCQICGETNRFPRRDGKAYFEAVYLIPHSEAAWTDDPGSVICLCALCSAKFQHGAVECQNIEQQIHSQKTAEEGGNGQPSIGVMLIGKRVVINFSERHLIEVQELLRVAAGGAETVTGKAPSPATGPQPGANTVTTPRLVAAGAGTAKHRLVRCPQCPPKASPIREDRLQKHIAMAHQIAASGHISFQGTAKSTLKYASPPRPVKEGLNSQSCRSCGKPVVPGTDYCRTHI